MCSSIAGVATDSRCVLEWQGILQLLIKINLKLKLILLTCCNRAKFNSCPFTSIKGRTNFTFE